MIESTEKLYVAVGQITGKISGLIQTSARLIAEGIGNELLRGQFWVIEITLGKADSADVKLACDADGNRRETCIQ